MFKAIKLLIKLYLGVSLCGLTKEYYFNIYDSRDLEVKSNIRFHTILFKKDRWNFSVSKSPMGHQFSTNSNFFTGDGNPIGGMVVDGKVISEQLPIGGSFYVRDRTPAIKFGKVRNCDHLSQSLICGIVGGRVNGDLLRESRSEEKTHKTLLGINSLGEVVLIHTNPFMEVNCRDILEYGVSKGIISGIILDGGSSQSIRLNVGEWSHSIESIPFRIKQLMGIGTPPSYICADII